MKIVNKRKFVRGIVLVISIILFMVLISISNISLSHGEVQYTDIYVSNGETLWSIATSQLASNAYYTNKDVREIIKDIKTLNELDSSVLQIGQRLLVPVL